MRGSFETRRFAMFLRKNVIIAFGVVDTSIRFTPRRRSFCAWNVARVNTGRFFKSLGATGGVLEGTPGGGNVSADIFINSVRNVITMAC